MLATAFHSDKTDQTATPPAEYQPFDALCKETIGHRISASTRWRWFRGKGKSGERLQGLLIAGKWYVRPADFIAFLERQTAAALGENRTGAGDDTGDSDDALKAAGLL